MYKYKNIFLWTVFITVFLLDARYYPVQDNSTGSYSPCTHLHGILLEITCALSDLWVTTQIPCIYELVCMFQLILEL